MFPPFPSGCKSPLDRFDANSAASTGQAKQCPRCPGGFARPPAGPGHPDGPPHSQCGVRSVRGKEQGKYNRFVIPLHPQ